MGIRAIPTPIQGDSHSFPFPFPIVSSIPIPMGFLWDSQWEWDPMGNPIPISMIISSVVTVTYGKVKTWAASLITEYRTATLFDVMDTSRQVTDSRWALQQSSHVGYITL